MHWPTMAIAQSTRYARIDWFDRISIGLGEMFEAEF